MQSEACGCGSAIKTWRYKRLKEWREAHRCVAPASEPEPNGPPFVEHKGSAHVEQSFGFTSEHMEVSL